MKNRRSIFKSLMFLPLFIKSIIKKEFFDVGLVQGRKIFSIDVGSMSSERALHYIESIKTDIMMRKL